MVLHLYIPDQPQGSECRDQRQKDGSGDGVRHWNGSVEAGAFDGGSSPESLPAALPARVLGCHQKAISLNDSNAAPALVARETCVKPDSAAGQSCGVQPLPVISLRSLQPAPIYSAIPVIPASGGIFTHEIACDACAGTGRRHFGACSWCERGWRMVRIAVHPDSTGIAPNWARWSAYDADRYDGAPDSVGAGSAVGCGQTAAEAVADLIERLEAQP